MVIKFNEETTIQDLLADPNKFGAPTFEQYKANSEKYKAISKGSVIDNGIQSAELRNIIDEQIYFVNGHRCDTLEKVEEVAKDFGYDLNSGNIPYSPEIQDKGGGKYKLVISFNLPPKNSKDANNESKLIL